MAVEAKFRESISLQKAMDVAVSVFHVTRTFPRQGGFGLSSQLQQASVCIASNLAEGHGRTTGNTHSESVEMALDSALEVQAELELATRLGHGVAEELAEVRKKVYDLIKIFNGLLAADCHLRRALK